MWNDLAYMGLRVRPFDGPPPRGAETYSRFQAPLRQTLRLLRRELEQLDAADIVVELDVRDRDIRLDGYPRADARLLSPAVRVTFASKHGPLRYETAEYRDWRDNLRAIALSMEALRAVDRYGVSKRGEQYRGWRALPTGTDPADAIQTREQAAALIVSLVEDLYDTTDVWYSGAPGPHFDSALREAIRRTHPDHGADRDPAAFRKVMRARELLA